MLHMCSEMDAEVPACIHRCVIEGLGGLLALLSLWTFPRSPGGDTKGGCEVSLLRPWCSPGCPCNPQSME